MPKKVKVVEINNNLDAASDDEIENKPQKIPPIPPSAPSPATCAEGAAPSKIPVLSEKVAHSKIPELSEKAAPPKLSKNLRLKAKQQAKSEIKQEVKSEDIMKALSNEDLKYKPRERKPKEVEEEEELKSPPKVKRQMSEKQMEAFIKARLIREQKIKEAKIIAEKEKQDYKKYLEQKVLKKAIRDKKKLIKLNKLLSDSESEAPKSNYTVQVDRTPQLLYI